MMWWGCGCATAYPWQEEAWAILCAPGLAVTPSAQGPLSSQGPPEGCLQLVCSPWNSPNPDCIITAVLLNVLFLPPGPTRTSRVSEAPVAPLLLLPHNPGKKHGQRRRL